MNITGLRQVVVDNSLLEDAASRQGESNHTACDEEFTRTLARCDGAGGPKRVACLFLLWL